MEIDFFMYFKLYLWIIGDYLFPCHSYMYSIRLREVPIFLLEFVEPWKSPVFLFSSPQFLRAGFWDVFSAAWQIQEEK